ncbi:MAG: nuclear transport factor 2 family protein [Alphaproteobacteria bacterium]|nr:nuclear transport factor 2 family protein [Alphaproteobacteria bacterium]MCB9698603.1 nuclear transport factor 2 family protein [Alphaproteobacteria bacterium]
MLTLALLLTAAHAEPDMPAEPVAEAPAPVDPAVLHDELRAVRAQLLDALKKKDLDAVVATLHPEVVFTTTNGEVARGRDGVKAWIGKMTSGPDALVKSFSYDVESDDLSVLIGGDTAIAWGPSTDRYTLSNGETWELHTRWSATLVKVDGTWLIASVHSSVDLFDNPVLDQATGMLGKVGLGALVGGLLIGLVAGALVGRATKK